MSKPEYVACIVVACGILHNIAIRNRLDLDLHEEDELVAPREIVGEREEEQDEDVQNNEGQGNRLYIQGLRDRDEIVAEYFEGQ